MNDVLLFLIKALLSLAVIAGVIYSVILHEIAHGLAAFKFGDDTAKNAGRLSFNPIKHIDPIGTVALPGVLIFLNQVFGFSLPVFGWAKPVPVNPENLRSRFGFTVVSLAGVIVNFLVALLCFFIAAMLLKYTTAGIAADILISIAQVNIMLMVFNLIPLPPLDGYNFIVSILPTKAALFLEKNRMILTGIFMLLLFTNWLSYIYTPVIRFFMGLMNGLFGL